ncbi:MAG: DUF4340 domain-containing protein [Bryobacteraceae bacterium]|nr:DUF4340 domain-containing protein [Bryobacteraceae bacterium]MDW8377158.1 DUF4340 domain-containing protein [Bryobacterales bacterium]
MTETGKTLALVAAAGVLTLAAILVEPERRTPAILSDQGETFYPKFTDPQAVRTIEVIDYDEATAAARPFQVEFRNGHWVLASHHNYPIDIGDRLVKTAGALMDLKKDQVVSDSAADHAKYGVVDPLDTKSASLTGRGKRVTLRDVRREVLADFILGRRVDGKKGMRYVRLPNDKRVYAVRTEADPSARFADWVNADLLRISSSLVRRIQILSYSIDEQFGRLLNLESTTLVQEGGKWQAQGGSQVNQATIQAIVSTLDGLKIVDVRPKPPSMAEGLRAGKLEMTLEGAMSLRQRGFFLSPTGRLLANEGELIVDTASGLVYVLRFGEVATSPGDLKPVATGNENRFLFVTVNYDAQRAAKYGDTTGAGERMARELNNRFADWYYVISGQDFQRLRPSRKQVGLPPQAGPQIAPQSPSPAPPPTPTQSPAVQPSPGNPPQPPPPTTSAPPRPPF